MVAFLETTVLDNIPDTARMSTSEIFVPTVAISTFRDDAEAVRRANATDAGLVAYVWTSGVERAFRLGEQLGYGMVEVSRGLVSDAAAPFGGIKQSGIGREGSTDGIEEYLDHTYLALSTLCGTYGPASTLYLHLHAAHR